MVQCLWMGYMYACKLRFLLENWNKLNQIVMLMCKVHSLWVPFKENIYNCMCLLMLTFVHILSRRVMIFNSNNDSVATYISYNYTNIVYKPREWWYACIMHTSSHVHVDSTSKATTCQALFFHETFVQLFVLTHNRQVVSEIWNFVGHSDCREQWFLLTDSFLV